MQEQKKQRLKLEQEQEFLDCLEKELRARREHLKTQEDALNNATREVQSPMSQNDEPISLDDFQASKKSMENEKPEAANVPKEFIRDYFQSFRKSLTEDIDLDLDQAIYADSGKMYSKNSIGLHYFSNPTKELRKKHFREEQQIAKMKQFLNNMTEDVALDHIKLDRVRDNWKKDLDEITKVSYRFWSFFI